MDDWKKDKGWLGLMATVAKTAISLFNSGELEVEPDEFWDSWGKEAR